MRDDSRWCSESSLVFYKIACSEQTDFCYGKDDAQQGNRGGNNADVIEYVLFGILVGIIILWNLSHSADTYQNDGQCVVAQTFSAHCDEYKQIGHDEISDAHHYIEQPLQLSEYLWFGCTFHKQEVRRCTKMCWQYAESERWGGINKPWLSFSFWGCVFIQLPDEPFTVGWIPAGQRVYTIKSFDITQMYGFPMNFKLHYFKILLFNVNHPSSYSQNYL